MSALDLLKELKEIDAYLLNPLQRILLITDGTLTEILEAQLLEPIHLTKLSQNIALASKASVNFEAKPDEKLIERKIFLQGEKSGKVYVYAESIIALERLDPKFQDALLNSNVPLGRLWLEHKLETFKELIEINCQPAADLHVHFGCKASSPLLSRTYRVISKSQPIMQISEYFLAG